MGWLFDWLGCFGLLSGWFGVCVGFGFAVLVGLFIGLVWFGGYLCLGLMFV